MPTKAGLPGWFPEDFSTDPELHAAFEDAGDWHAAGQARKPGKAAVKARLRARLKDRTAGRGSEHATISAQAVDLAAAAVPGQTVTPTSTKAVSPAKSASASAQPRVGAGSPAGGQFAPAGSGTSGSKPMDAHQAHVAHLQHLAAHGTPAQQKAAQAQLAQMNARSKTPAKAGATAKTAPKAAAPKAASVKAKPDAHQQHVAHLQHLAAHGNPAQQKAAAALLAKLGVKSS